MINAGRGRTARLLGILLTGGTMVAGCSSDGMIAGDTHVLFFALQPANAESGVLIAPVQVVINDASGIPAPESDRPVKISLEGALPGAVLGGTTTVRTTNGRATFADLRIDQVGANYRLVAASAGLRAVLSSPFTVAVPQPPAPSWLTRAPMPTGRSALAVAEVGGVLYAIGGFMEGREVTAAVEAYDPRSNTWMARAAMPTARAGLAVGVINDIIYAVGGYSAPDGMTTSVVEAYDPLTDRWSTKTSMSMDRAGLAVGVANGILYAVGGISHRYFNSHAEAEAYDPLTDRWRRRYFAEPRESFFGATRRPSRRDRPASASRTTIGT